MTESFGTEAPHALRDYALLADGIRGAMIDPGGEIAWLCFPGWSDPAPFASLLGSAGSYRVAPKGRWVHGGYYEDGTLIWRQRWVTEDGIIECRQCLAYPGQPDRAVLLRRITALQRATSVSVRLLMSGDYGRAAGLRWHRQDGLWVSDSDGVHARWSGAADAIPKEGAFGAELQFECRLPPGQPHDLVLEIQRQVFNCAPPNPDDLWKSTAAAWNAAVPSCRDVPAGRDVRRSFAVLRGMTDEHGATAAAATTSLPERAEAGRNYDYRYAWIRDTCYIGHAGAAVEGGEEVLDDAVKWVCARILSDGPQTRPAYRGDGAPVPETEHLGVPGYPGGSDIIGNQARSQFQLDLFGEALLLLANAASRDRLDPDGWRAAELAMHVIEERNTEKESGIWEVGPEHWTHSRLICVAGLRAISEQAAPARWSTTALTLADSLLSQADRTSLHPSGRWQRTPNDDRVDASLLLADVRGALTSDDPRSVATRHAVIEDLCEDDYLYRYGHSGRPLGEQEGAFLICNFWLALAELRAGNIVSGAQWFERTRASCSSTGLFSEEYDVTQRQLRGNLPQAFVHALFIESAAELGRA